MEILRLMPIESPGQSHECRGHRLLPLQGMGIEISAKEHGTP
jgi:hypothetical protein